MNNVSVACKLLDGKICDEKRVDLFLGVSPNKNVKTTAYIAFKRVLEEVDFNDESLNWFTGANLIVRVECTTQSLMWCERRENILRAKLWKIIEKNLRQRGVFKKGEKR